MLSLSPGLRRPTALGLTLSLALGACTEPIASGSASPRESRPVPIEVGRVERGPLTYRRTVSGSLEAAAEFVVAPKLGGRIVRLELQLGDRVKRGQIVARLDDDEWVQAAQQAEAELAVASASRSEARSALAIAQRTLKRQEQLRSDGMASESQLDVSLANEVASRAHLEVTEANVARAEALLRAARIRVGYTAVTADWSGADEYRVVGERFVDEGGNVAPNAALLSIVQLDPILAVVYVAERDYRLLAVGQRAELTTDAYPGRVFEGRVARIAPIFRSSTRQARVELELANPGADLKPGMFVRATLELDHVADAVSVPVDALTEREGATGVLVLDEDEQHVRWQSVVTGIGEGARVQILEPALGGRVVTLGQELCDDGARVSLIDAATDIDPR